MTDLAKMAALAQESTYTIETSPPTPSSTAGSESTTESGSGSSTSSSAAPSSTGGLMFPEHCNATCSLVAQAFSVSSGILSWHAGRNADDRTAFLAEA